MSKSKQEYRIAFIDPDGHTEYSEWTCDGRLGYGYHLGWLRGCRMVMRKVVLLNLNKEIMSL